VSVPKQPTVDEVMDSAHVPNMEIRRWHWWLLYGLALVTVILGAATTFGIIRAGTAVSEVRGLTQQNQDALCSIARLRLDNEPATPTEHALRDYYRAQDERGCPDG
jgi:hypothetical protein